MLLALLYTDDGSLAAAAPACDALALGTRYWRDAHGQEIAPAETCEIACIEIDDELLLARLLEIEAGEADERHDAAQAVDAYLFGMRRSAPMVENQTQET